jgi:CubicO group peptidase (beta-lactamase class C family)
MTMRALSLLSVLAVLAVLTLAGCLFDQDFKHRNTTVPAPLDDGWEIATPESVGLAPQALAAIHDELLKPDRFVGTLGFLVIKDNKLVFETYLRDPADRDHVQHMQSTTKSVTSIVFGMGRDQGWMPALDTPVCTILASSCAGLDARKQAIALEHLLTMRSGLDFDNDVFSVEMWVEKPANPIRYILDKPLYATPGTVYYYRDADPQLISYALQALTGRNEESLAAEFLFGPLGIRDYYWDHGEHGESMGAHGLHLRPRDLAKIGQLMLDEWRVARHAAALQCLARSRHHLKGGSRRSAPRLRLLLVDGARGGRLLDLGPRWSVRLRDSQPTHGPGPGFASRHQQRQAARRDAAALRRPHASALAVAANPIDQSEMGPGRSTST